MQRSPLIVPGHDLDSMKEQKNKTGQPSDGEEKIVGSPADIPGNEIKKKQATGCSGQGKKNQADQGMTAQTVQDDETS